MKWFSAWGALLLAALFTTPTLACSICRCGDPTYNALGHEGVAQVGWRFAFDWDEVKKTQGVRGDDFETMRESRSTLLLAYGVSDRIGLFARLPYSERELTETEAGESERLRTSGLADPEMHVQVRLWSSPFEGDVGARFSVFAILGVKTPWGENDISRGGERLDEHVQAGTGSTDELAGLSASYQLNPRSALFASTQYRFTGRNDFGYRYGRIALFNLAYEYKFNSRWDAALEANYRHAGTDSEPQNTGGSIAYLTPRLLFDAGHGWVLRASSQLPLSQSGLNGHQREKAVYNLGITRLFN